MVVKIERTKPRAGGYEEPCLYEGGYQLADPAAGPDWHKVENATFVQTLEQAAGLIEQRGFAIRMSCKGKRPSLIRPSGIRVIR